LISIGIDSKTSKDDAINIELVNSISVIGMVLIIVNSINNALQQEWTDVMAGFILGAVLIFTLVLNYFRKYFFAKLFQLVTLISIIALIHISYGNNLKLEPLYMIFVVSGMISFQNKYWKIFVIFFVILSYILVNYWLSFNEAPLAGNISFISNYLYFFFSVLIIALLVSSILKTNRNQNEEIEERNKELNGLINMASHQFKTPLRNINTYANLTNKLPVGDLELSKTYLSKILLESKNLYDILDQFAFLSELSNSDLVKKQKIDFQNFMDSFTITYPELKVSKTINYSLNSNFDYLKKIVTILIENGIEHNTSKNPIVEVYTEKNTSELIVYFKDNGIGIDTAFKNRIFETLFIANKKEKYKGGIGLAIAKKLCGLLKVRLELKSSIINEGSVFALYFPLDLLSD